MDMFYIPAIASFSGSASGTLASIVTNWVTQRRKDRFRHSLRATSQREELYKNFIEEAVEAVRRRHRQRQVRGLEARRPLRSHRADEDPFERCSD